MAFWGLGTGDWEEAGEGGWGAGEKLRQVFPYAQCLNRI